VLERIALRRGVHLFSVPRHLAVRIERVDRRGSKFIVKGIWGEKYQCRIRLLGEHQIQNALNALATVEALQLKGIRIPKSAIRKGLHQASWPGRLQIVAHRPTIVLDGAHNPAAATILAKALDDLFKSRSRILILGVLEDKDLEGILRVLVPGTRLLIATQPLSPRAVPAEVMGRMAAQYCPQVLVKKTVKEALVYARRQAKREDLICLTGSLYTAAEGMRILGRINGN
jgi:dihydrofolate synthase/folylpolyglutamate synthase